MLDNLSNDEGWLEQEPIVRRPAPRSLPSTPAQPAPVFEELDYRQCNTIMDRNRVGRIAYAFQNQVDIAPVHYVRRGTWLYGRTSSGSKLTTLSHAPWVAFEVDEMEALFEWRSVIVHGAFYRLQPGGTAYDVEAWDTGVEALRELIPDTFTRGDPVPFRTEMFRISIDRMSGRSSHTAAGKGV
jgi:nitroimidazol reductase NimA-like FMN-containing flavoprotein (pyridoxamine 5'-phosphate oxidase superfamily)